MLLIPVKNVEEIENAISMMIIDEIIYEEYMQTTMQTYINSGGGLDKKLLKTACEYFIEAAFIDAEFEWYE